MAFARADFDWINERILTEAEDRDWCDEFDTIIEEANRAFKIFEFQTRTKTTEMEVTVTIRVESKDDVNDEIGSFDIESVLQDYVETSMDVESVQVEIY